MKPAILLGLVFALAAGQLAMADTIIDTFEDFDPTLWPLVANSDMTSDVNSQSGVPGVVGGVRQGRADWMSGPTDPPGVFNVRADVSSGVFRFSTDVLTDGAASLSYPGTNGLNLDLTYAGDPSVPGFGAAFIIEVVRSDLGVVPIEVTLIDGGGVSSTASGMAAGGGTVSIPLSEFGGISFSDVDQIDVSFDPPAAAFDIVVDFIGFDWPEVQPEPEPASILVWSLVGLIGIVAARRFRARKH